MKWDDGDDSIPDGEVTRDTELAFEIAKQAAEDQLGNYWAWAVVGSELRINTEETYIAVIRGQSSATGHGKHGSHPDRLAEYREMTVRLGDPTKVWLVYVEPGANVYYHGWLHALPDAHPISTVVGAERYGWNARKDPEAWDAELTRAEGPIVFPKAPEVPGPREDLFGPALENIVTEDAEILRRLG